MLLNKSDNQFKISLDKFLSVFRKAIKKLHDIHPSVVLDYPLLINSHSNIEKPSERKSKGQGRLP